MRGLGVQLKILDVNRSLRSGAYHGWEAYTESKITV
jgi:hypothetical protein